MAKSRKQIVTEIEAIYERLPRMDCKGLCTDWCAGPIPASRPERARVRACGKPLSLIEGPCSNLTADNKCAVYSVRPMICRLWGVAENMPCPHGCVPEGGYLSRTEAAAILDEIVNVAGEAVF